MEMLIAAFVTFLLMEPLTWANHRYIMHGFLWRWHRSHHVPHTRTWERNDLFFLVYALPTIVLIIWGIETGRPVAAGIGMGISAYGLAYAIVHDVFIHRRLKWFRTPQGPGWWARYLRALAFGHRRHHKHLGQHPGECYGFLWVAPKYWEPRPGQAPATPATPAS